MTVYISGKITGDSGHKEKFARAAERLMRRGYDVVNPCCIGEHDFLSYEDYMHIDFAIIDVCGAVYMLADWEGSPGARREKEYAESKGKEILYEPV